MREYLERVGDGGLRSSRDLHIILDALPVPLSWATIPNGNIQFVNRAFRRTFGYPDGAFATADQWIDATYVHEEQRRKSRERWASLWRGEMAGFSEIEGIEIDVRCADGTILTVMHRGVILHDLGVGVAIFADISERKRHEEAVARLAYRDPLTGLPNRRLLQERWRMTMGGGPAALLLVDLDGFKPVNDRHGHDVGDDVLCGVAARLSENVGGGDLVCRLGGDEFGILIPNAGDLAQVAATCDRLTSAISTPFSTAGELIGIGASIGVSLYPHHGSELQQLFRLADQALYRIKRAGKGGWEWSSRPTAA